MSTKVNINDYIKKHPEVPYRVGAKKFGVTYGNYYQRYRTIHGKGIKEMGFSSQPSADEDALKSVEVSTQRDEAKISKRREAQLIEEVKRLRKELEAAQAVAPTTTTIIPIGKHKRSEMAATAVVLASDWHAEEEVLPDTINGLNEFNLQIFDERANRFFQNTAKLIHEKQKALTVETLVMALLGDFISGNIHDENLETGLLAPIQASMMVESKIAAGINLLLKDTDVRLVIPCHAGNHPRLTKKTRFATEVGNALEYWMYHHLAGLFKGNPRVEFRISNGYHSYLNIGEFRIRFHHGHRIRYWGGVGGLTIPVNKAIAEWDKSRPADLDCFGHFHQFLWPGKFFCNGSLIGYNAFALGNKCAFEKPKQAFFLVNHQRNEVHDVCPVWLT